MDIYLHELDIDEYGTEIKLPCPLDEYMLKYAFFIDTVYLQSSSSLKRQDMFYFFIRYHDLFISGSTDDNKPLISFVLDPDYESLNHYIENRIELLEKNSSGEQNIERTIYKANSAIKKSLALDSKISDKDIKRRDHNVNTFFKHYLLELASEIAVLGMDDFSKGAVTISDYVLNNNFIQTFKLREKLDNVMVNSASSDKLGKHIRECYFKANAAAVNCTYQSKDWRLQYRNLNTYAELIGLNRIFRYNWKLDRALIETIKRLDSLQSLRAIYFNFETVERFAAFCNYLKSPRTFNTAYLFYEYSHFLKNAKAFHHNMNRLKRTIVSYHEERG